jgi:hypothetical protein
MVASRSPIIPHRAVDENLDLLIVYRDNAALGSRWSWLKRSGTPPRQLDTVNQVRSNTRDAPRRVSTATAFLGGLHGRRPLGPCGWVAVHQQVVGHAGVPTLPSGDQSSAVRRQASRVRQPTTCSLNRSADPQGMHSRLESNSLAASAKQSLPSSHLGILRAPMSSRWNGLAKTTQQPACSDSGLVFTTVVSLRRCGMP